MVALALIHVKHVIIFLITVAQDITSQEGKCHVLGWTPDQAGLLVVLCALCWHEAHPTNAGQS